MCVPSGVTEVETRAVEEACLSAGARQVALIEEPVAAALGAGLEIAEPTGHMVVDVGGGTSEGAVISMGEIVVETSLRLRGYDPDRAIMARLRPRRGHHRLRPPPREHGDRAAERGGDQDGRRLRLSDAADRRGRGARP